MAKTANYTPEMETIVREGYDPKASAEERKAAVARIAEQIGRSVASVRQKLVRENLYVKPERKAKDGSAIVTKAAMVATIAKACDQDAEDFDSLEKATKNVLRTLIENLE